MTAASMHGDRPPDRIPHSWRCTRPPAEDHYTTDRRTGEPVVVKRCPGCGGRAKPRPT
jgi:hypothetical protein